MFACFIAFCIIQSSNVKIFHASTRIIISSPIKFVSIGSQESTCEKGKRLVYLSRVPSVSYPRRGDNEQKWINEQNTSLSTSLITMKLISFYADCRNYRWWRLTVFFLSFPFFFLPPVTNKGRRGRKPIVTVMWISVDNFIWFVPAMGMMYDSTESLKMELAASPCYGFHFIRARNNETIGVQTRTMKEGGGMGRKTNKKKKRIVYPFGGQYPGHWLPVFDRLNVSRRVFFNRHDLETPCFESRSRVKVIL